MAGSERATNDHFRDECGVFGIFGHPEASRLTYLGLHALQHRGQESAGIVSSDGRELHSHRAMGLVADIFRRPEILDELPGDVAIGHVRYSTAGESKLKNAQPFVVEYARGGLAVAHNGNFTNANELRDDLSRQGAIFQSTSDTEVLIHLIARSAEIDLTTRAITALGKTKGAFSILFCSENEIVAARDLYGFRPLMLGKLKNSFVVASETCAFDLIEAEPLREILPGEVVTIRRNGLTSQFPWGRESQPGRCLFEYVYFSRPDSVVYGRSVHAVRRATGRQLAIEQPAEGDIVIPVPDSGLSAALGYAEQSKIPFEMGLVRNHYVGRTFIEPRDSIRHFGVKLKLNAMRATIEGRRVVVIDDSLVRGTTSRKIVKMLRVAGAREVHLRIASPPTLFPCYYGINTPTRQELIASSHSQDEICKYVTADSLGYLSLEGLKKAAGEVGTEFCHACFSGDYPVNFGKNATIVPIRGRAS